MKYQLLIILLLGLSLGTAGAGYKAADISGTWACSIEIGEPKTINVTFVFKQEGENLSGAYSGGLGEHQVSGTVKGDKVAFSFDVTFPDKPSIKVSYTGAVESPTKMTGAVEYIGGGTRGKWTATKKK
jgi:hypothetical protein